MYVTYHRKAVSRTRYIHRRNHALVARPLVEGDKADNGVELKIEDHFHEEVIDLVERPRPGVVAAVGDELAVLSPIVRTLVVRNAGTLPRFPNVKPRTSKKQKVKSFVHPDPTLSEAKWITSKEALGDLERLPLDESFSHIWSVAKKSAEQGNRKLKADKPSATMRAECHGNIQFHYDLKRRISMREAARIQSFPDNFTFQSKLRATERQIGNAVPPVLAWHIAKAVRNCLE